ncbi:MAG: DUF4199 domain-containing protein [Bacteroidales bacterium]|nr:DUF4199 domain-containing protein [Bacteroidales bacterium]
MEEKVNPWKANLTNGLILGIVGIMYSLVMYFLDLTFNQIQGYVFIVVQIGLIYFLLKSYRDNFMHGQITYGQSLGAGMIIFLYSAIIVAVYTYLLYTVIDSGLVAKQLAFQEAEMVKRGIPQASIDAGMAMQAKIMKPAIIAPISILGSMFWGLIVSLLISIFIRKEGNPLIETPQN